MVPVPEVTRWGGDTGVVTPPHLLPQRGLVLGVPVMELHDVQQALHVPGEGTGHPPEIGGTGGPHCRARGSAPPPPERALPHEATLGGGAGADTCLPHSTVALGTVGTQMVGVGVPAMCPPPPKFMCFGRGVGTDPATRPPPRPKISQGWHGDATSKQPITWPRWEKVQAATSWQGTWPLKGHPEPVPRTPRDTPPCPPQPPGLAWPFQGAGGCGKAGDPPPAPYWQQVTCPQAGRQPVPPKGWVPPVPCPRPRATPLPPPPPSSTLWICWGRELVAGAAVAAGPVGAPRQVVAVGSPLGTVVGPGVMAVGGWGQ